MMLAYLNWKISIDSNTKVLIEVQNACMTCSLKLWNLMIVIIIDPRRGNSLQAEADPDIILIKVVQ